MAERAYYNEWDSYAAQWLRNLAAAGHIAPGHVDSRSIRDVRAVDLDGFDRVHLFAGIAGWDLALHIAGWTAPVWTISCPCQPFTRSGAVHNANRKFDDERHLWPECERLIRECRPSQILGEQVPDAVAAGWWDLVAGDLERHGYACGAIRVEAGALGEPIRRERLWFAAQHLGEGTQGQRASSDPRPSRQARWRGEADLRAVADAPLIAGDRWPQPLVRRVDHGRADCVGALHAFGNGLNITAAVAFVEAVMATLAATHADAAPRADGTGG